MQCGTWWGSKCVLSPLLYAGLQVPLHIHGRGSRREVHIQQQLHGEKEISYIACPESTSKESEQL